MTQKKLVSITLFSLMIAIPLLISPAFGQTKPIALNYSLLYPATHKNSALATDWAKEIEKRTNGRVKITMFYGGTLTPPDKCYDGVVNKISDIGWGVFSYTRGKFPLTEVTDLPLGFTDALVATKLVNEYYKKFRPRELDEVKVLYLNSHGPAFIHTKTPVNRLEDLKGMKIRAGGLNTKVIEALGATPVSMPISDAYDALSRGVAEGLIAPMEALEGFRLGEVVKVTNECFQITTAGGQYVIMNKGTWNSLPPDIQNTIEKVNQEWIEKTGKTWNEIDESGRNFSLKLGNKVIVVPKEEGERWAKAVKPVLDNYVKETKAKGLPGDEVLKFYQDYLSKYR
jgi:TRAP-type transport system periplasmic protein